MANKIEFQVLGDIKDIQEKLGTLSEGFGNLSKISSISFAALTASAAGFTEAAREQELAINQLNQALKNQGNYSEDTSKGLQKYADSLQDVSLFDNTAIVKAEALIASFGFQGDMVKQLTKATLDLAQAKGLDLVSAADLVSKAVGSETNALGRYGITIDGAAGSTARANSFIENSGRLFGGQALAATQGLGSIVQLKNSMDDLSKSIGEALSPTVTKLSTDLKDFFNFIAKNPEVTQAIANFIVMGISVSALGIGVGVLGKAFTGLTAAMTAFNASAGVFKAFGLNTEIGILIKNVGFLGPLAVVAGTAFASWNLTKLILDVNHLNGALSANQDIISKLISSSNNGQIKEIEEKTQASLAAHNQTLEQIKEDSATRLAALQIRQAAETVFNNNQIQQKKSVDDFFATSDDQLKQIADVRTQTELTDLIQKFNDERQALIEHINIKEQILDANGLLDLKKKQDFEDQKAAIDAQYDGIEFAARQEQSKKLSALDQAGLDLAKKVNNDKLGSLASTLQQAAELNKGFGIAYQAVAIAQATISTAEGIANALSLPFPLNFVVGSLIAAQGAIQIATIASQSFAVGSGQIPKDTVAQVHKDEIIVPATFSDAIRSGQLSLSGGQAGNNSSKGSDQPSIVFDFSGAQFNGITDQFVQDIFTRASEKIFNKTLAFRGVK